ncbi:hypothetical protein BX666DRAFT_2054732 [Dichotomocladium elegans]|nr:hypothetical protein BX666DRAFT_2054732 [Dichotomocladium elegans]
MFTRRSDLHPWTGRAPAGRDDMDTQKQRVLRYVRSRPSMLDKYLLMAQLRTSRTDLFYKVVIEELQEFAPIIYTPTVGTACLEHSNIYPFLAGPGVADGLYLTGGHDLQTQIGIIQNYCAGRPAPEIAVITDGSRILGLGDLGVNGMPIAIGKLQLYVACAGIHPDRTLPITLDLGTNNKAYREDPFYLGVRQTRPKDAEFYSSVDKVLSALHTVFPAMLIQFEDWSSNHAFGLLQKYQHRLPCFNDDIQGTGAVILAGFINAIALSGTAPDDQRIVFFGAGSAAIGVARQIQKHFETEYQLSEDRAKKMFFVVDSKGLITLDRGDTLAEHKVYYARDDNQGHQYTDLLSIIQYVRPTALIGLSSISGAFNQQVLQKMAELNPNPIIFPLSNPLTKAECTFKQAMQYTNNKVIFASGTAFEPYTIPDATNKTVVPAQGNNMYIFPGLGLGAILSKSKVVSDNMVYQAAKALAACLTEHERAKGMLYPALQRIRQVSADVAEAVVLQALAEGQGSSSVSFDATRKGIRSAIEATMWNPDGDRVTSSRI